MLQKLIRALRGKPVPNPEAAATARPRTASPCGIEALLAQGKQLESAGRIDEATALYESKLRLLAGQGEPPEQRHDDATIALHRAIIGARLRAGNPGEAEASGHQLLALAPNDPFAHFELGRIYQETQRPELAHGAFEQALSLDSDHIPSLTAMGILCDLYGHWQRSREAFERAARVDPADAQLQANLGIILCKMGELGDSRQALQRALELHEQDAETVAMLAGVEMLTGNLEASKAHFVRALELEPDNPDVRYKYGLLRLTQGDFARGWVDYDFGLRTDSRRTAAYDLPVWDAGSLHDRTLVLLAEQGIGDEVMFANCINDVLSRAEPQACVVQCDSRLDTLFKRSFPGIMTVAKPVSLQDFSGELSVEADAQLAIGSLPGLYRRQEADFPAHYGYLRADPARQASFRARFAALKKRLVVGVSWRGGARPDTQLSRSIALEHWLPVLQVPQIAFVNIQYGDCDAEVAALTEKGGCVLHPPEIDCKEDIEGFAALLSALDLIISVDNSTVHFAGALGVKTWLLLPANADWRWMRDREDTPWYPSLTLLRRAADAAPGAATEQLAARLHAYVQAMTPG
jgi:tetratricopeptide (TPR) repeat protein